MDGEIILTQNLDLSGVKPYEPPVFQLRTPPPPSFWDKMMDDPSALILGAILVVAVIGVIIYVRRNKSA